MKHKKELKIKEYKVIKQLYSENISETLGLNRSHPTHCEEHSKEPLELNQLGFTEGKPFLINRIAFCDKITGFVDKGGSVDITSQL